MLDGTPWKPQVEIGNGLVAWDIKSPCASTTDEVRACVNVSEGVTLPDGTRCDSLAALFGKSCQRPRGRWTRGPSGGRALRCCWRPQS
jgi:hypothetical protein